MLYGHAQVLRQGCNNLVAQLVHFRIAEGALSMTEGQPKCQVADRLAFGLEDVSQRYFLQLLSTGRLYLKRNAWDTH